MCHTFHSHDETFTTFEADMTHPLPSYSNLELIHYMTLTVDLGQWSHIGSHVINFTTRFENPYPIHSEVRLVRLKFSGTFHTNMAIP